MGQKNLGKRRREEEIVSKKYRSIIVACEEKN
jgi:hypothetical protein